MVGSDPVLLAAVRAGDRDAVETLYRRYRAEGLGFARSLVRHEHDADDVMHEAFTKTISALDNGFGPNENFLAYLYTAIRATAAGVWKKSTRELPVDTGDLETALDPVHDDRFEAVLNEVTGQAGNERVLAAMQVLPVRWRTVLWYADVLQEPPRRIAPLMGIEPNAVSALLRRARAGLRTAYLETLPEETPTPATAHT